MTNYSAMFHIEIFVKFLTLFSVYYIIILVLCTMRILFHSLNCRVMKYIKTRTLLLKYTVTAAYSYTTRKFRMDKGSVHYITATCLLSAFAENFGYV